MQDFAVTANVLRRELGFPEGDLYEGCPLEFANRLWLSKSIDKKFLPVGPAKELADSRCLTLFLENNEKCRTSVLQPQTLREELVIEAVKGFFDRLVFRGPELLIDRDAITSRFMTGPGASQGASSFNFYSKLFGSRMTYSSELLYRVYLDCLKAYPIWYDGEILRSSTFGEQQVVGNRLSFAPKTSIISRSICTEPNLNMLFQKGIGSCVEAGLMQVFNIDLATQPTKNRKLARIGSIDGTYGTIDLSSASDSMSLTILRSLIPQVFFKWLELARSPVSTFPGGAVHELHMVSSMGNGFTFPLQTYLFSSIVSAAYQVLGVKPSSGRKLNNFGVFGDDIVVLKDTYDFVVRCLEMFGFSVNNEKSFNSGSFRESCGGDYLRGHEIRGVYVQSLANDADVYSAINRLVRWSSRTGIFIPETVTHLRSLLRGKTLWIPWKDGDAEGVKVSVPPKHARVHPSTGATVYSALVAKGVSFAVPDSPEQERLYPYKNGKRTKVFFNPDGLLVSLVAGFIRCGRISVRNDRPTFKVRRRMTSSWSGLRYPPDSGSLLLFLTNLDQGVSSERNFYPCYDSSTVGHTFDPGDDWKVISDLYFF